jgi:hypothetical protein
MEPANVTYVRNVEPIPAPRRQGFPGPDLRGFSDRFSLALTVYTVNVLLSV